MVKNAFLTTTLATILIVTLAASAPAATSGSIVLFDGVAYDFTSIDLNTATFQDGGDGTSLGTNFAGAGLGYYEGATIAEDRLYMTDETDTGGEDVAILIGPNPATYEFDSSATLDYVMDRSAGGSDPHGIEWVSNASDGTTVGNDANIWMTRASNFLASALDQDGYNGAGSFVDWASSTADLGLSAVVNTFKASAMCKSSDGTKLYAGGGIQSPTGEAWYGYKVIDVATNTMVSDNTVVMPQTGKPFGPSPPLGDIIDFALHAMATDRVHDTYLMLVKSGTDTATERRLFRFNTFPDPGPDPINYHLEGTGGTSFRLDDVLTFNSRPDRMGMATGRAVNLGGGVSYPVIYILNGTDGLEPTRLYTLVPQPRSADVESWKTYR